MKIYNNKKLIETTLRNSKTNPDNYTYTDYKEVLDKLEDEHSKYNLFYRIMYDNTYDLSYALKLVQCMYYNQSLADMNDLNMKLFIKFLLKNDNYKKDIHIFGYTISLDAVINSLKNFSWGKQINLVSIYENMDVNQEWNYRGVEVKSTNNINDLNEDSIIVVFSDKFDSDTVYENYLKKFNIPEENIYTTGTDLYNHAFFKFCHGIQYFGEPFLEVTTDEIFIDGGTCNFDTCLLFFNFNNKKYRKIYCFEPNETEFNKCVKYVEQYKIKNVELHQKGLYSSDANMKFRLGETGDSAIDENYYDIKIPVTSIDKVLKGREATLIKLDIEGSEYQALIGAEKTIKKYKPRLMISGYHLPNDCIKLTKKILEYNSEYKVYIRHYNYNVYETVIYFV